MSDTPKAPTVWVTKAIRTALLVEIRNGSFVIPKSLAGAADWAKGHKQVIAELYALYGWQHGDIAYMMDPIMRHKVDTNMIARLLAGLGYTPENLIAGRLPALPAKAAGTIAPAAPAAQAQAAASDTAPDRATQNWRRAYTGTQGQPQTMNITLLDVAGVVPEAATERPSLPVGRKSSPFREVPKQDPVTPPARPANLRSQPRPGEHALGQRKK